MQTLRSISAHSFVEKTFSDGGMQFPSLVAGNSDAKKTIVIVHGVTGNKNDMVVVGREYAKHGYAVYIPDLPGHGAAPALHADSFQDLSDWLAAYVSAAQVVPDVLMGNSFGSAVCYNLAQRGLLQSDATLALACPTPHVALMSRALRLAGERLPARWLAMQYNADWAIWLRTQYLVMGRSKQAAQWLTESERAKADFLNVKLAERFSALLDTDNPYMTPLDPDVQRRTVIMIGQKDNVITRQSVPFLQSHLPHSRFVSIPRAGHILHFEAYRDLARIA